jgi:Rieske Fe-S protein
MQMERRKFLESACKACMFAGAGILISELNACSPSAKVLKLPVMDDKISMPISSFANSPVQLVLPAGWLYTIVVRQTSSEQYEAILLQCTHQQNQLISTGNGFQCTLHGSRFNQDGQVLKGPAEKPLKKFETLVEQGKLIVQLKSKL